MKPSEEYTIHILDDDDFDMLPIGEPLKAQGMTDAKRKTAWVRRSGVKHLDMMTINHEFDELMQGTSLHEIDGIRYKSRGDLGRIIGPIIGSIVGVVTGSPTLGAAVSAGITGGTTRSVKSAAIGGVQGFAGASLINAGSVAATNAAIAGGTGNTLATLGAGIKGAGAAALSGVSGAATQVGGKSAFSDLTSGNQQVGSLPGVSQGSSFTSPFTPQTAKNTPGPLSDIDFQKGLSDIGSNLTSRLGSIGQLFRGQSESENTAFSGQASAARTSAAKSREDFISQQDQAKKVAGIF